MAAALDYYTDAITSHSAPGPSLRELLSLALQPTRRNINVALNLMLPILLVTSFVTGWIASLFGLSEFGLHKYSSIAVFAVAGAHVALHWRSLSVQMLRLRGGQCRRNAELHTSEYLAESAACAPSRPEDWIQAVIAQNGTRASAHVRSTAIRPRLAGGGALVVRPLVVIGGPSSSVEKGARSPIAAR